MHTIRPAIQSTTRYAFHRVATGTPLTTHLGPRRQVLSHSSRVLYALDIHTCTRALQYRASDSPRMNVSSAVLSKSCSSMTSGGTTHLPDLPLHIAAKQAALSSSRKAADAFSERISLQPELNVQNSEGDTPLMSLLKIKPEELPEDTFSFHRVSLLLIDNTDLSLRNKAGQTARDIAVEYGHSTAICLIDTVSPETTVTKTISNRKGKQVPFEQLDGWKILDQETFSPVSNKASFYKTAAATSESSSRPAYVVVGDDVVVNITKGYTDMSTEDDTIFQFSFFDVSFPSLCETFGDQPFELAQIIPGKTEDTIREYQVNERLHALRKSELSKIPTTISESELRKSLQELTGKIEVATPLINKAAAHSSKLMMQLPAVENFSIALRHEIHYRHDTNQSGLKQTFVSPYGMFSLSFDKESLPKQHILDRDAARCFDILYDQLAANPFPVTSERIATLFDSAMPYCTVRFEPLSDPKHS